MTAAVSSRDNISGTGNSLGAKSPTVRLQTCSPRAIISRTSPAILRIGEPIKPSVRIVPFRTPPPSATAARDTALSRLPPDLLLFAFEEVFAVISDPGSERTILLGRGSADTE